MTSVISTILPSLILVSGWITSSAPDSFAARTLGESLYQSHCSRCHGIDGDATDYYDIVPLAGIRRRPPSGLVGLFRQDSFSARGVEFSGEHASALRYHLFRLQGSKGFADPGWLWSPYLLRRKAALTKACRILDLRDSAHYSSGHIPNAVSLPGERYRAVLWSAAESVALLVQELGIDAETQVVIYDEIGATEAAWVWWNLVQAGHPYVAVLDGGWRNWVTSGYPVSDQDPTLQHSNYTPRLRDTAPQFGTSDSPSKSISWDWTEAIGPRGFEEASSLSQWLTSCGFGMPGLFKVQGTEKEAAFLVLALRVLGRLSEVSIMDDSHFLLHVQAAQADL